MGLTSRQPKGSSVSSPALITPTTNSERIRIPKTPVPILAGAQIITAVVGRTKNKERPSRSGRLASTTGKDGRDPIEFARMGYCHKVAANAKTNTTNSKGNTPSGCSISVLAAPAATSMPPIRPNQSPSCVGTGRPMSKPIAIQAPVKPRAILTARCQPGLLPRNTTSIRVAQTGER